MYRRDRFLAYNILSLVANGEETKRARGLAFGFIAGSVISRLLRSPFARRARPPFPSSFFSVFRRMIARPDAFYGALTPRCRRRRCYVRSTSRKSGSTECTVICTVTTFRGGEMISCFGAFHGADGSRSKYVNKCNTVAHLAFGALIRCTFQIPTLNISGQP